MRHAAGKASYGFHLVRLPQALLQFVLFFSSAFQAFPHSLFGVGIDAVAAQDA